jgi:hypothetical protein
MITSFIAGVIAGPYLLFAILGLILLAEFLYCFDNYKSAIFFVYTTLLAIAYLVTGMSVVDFAAYIIGFVLVGIVVSVIQTRMDLSSYKKKLASQSRGSSYTYYKWIRGIHVKDTAVESVFDKTKLAGFITTYILIWPVVVVDWVLRKVIIAIVDWIVENIGGYITRQLKAIDESINKA